MKKNKNDTIIIGEAKMIEFKGQIKEVKSRIDASQDKVYRLLVEPAYLSPELMAMIDVITGDIIVNFKVEKV